jgi:hypothetical protein
MRFFSAEKILPSFFRLREIHKKLKNSYFCQFLALTPTNGVYDPMPEFSLSYTISDSNLVRIGDMKFNVIFENNFLLFENFSSKTKFKLEFFVWDLT